jgi:hypothetical protein
MGNLFLSYAREDYDAVCKVYTALRDAKLNPWMDQPPAPWQAEGIPLGAFWKPYLKEKIASAELVLCFFSSVSVSKTGYVQTELRYALSCVALRPANQRFLIPIRLDECKIADIEVDKIQLSAIQKFDLFRYGISVLVEGLGGRRSDQPKFEPALLDRMLEYETRRADAQSAKQDRRIAELEEELAYARKWIPPAEAYDDEHFPGFMKWWHDHKDD